ncbi:kinase-like domain-containing protein [Boletus edulis]|nr:kinase-like domain-containing protein [Boletus edulis]
MNGCFQYIYSFIQSPRWLATDIFSRFICERVTSPSILDLTDHIVNLQYLEGGSFGDVYKCQLHGGSRTKEIAVKAFRFRLTLEVEGVDKPAKDLHEELCLWRRLTHRNIVPFLGVAYGFGMQNSTSFVSLWMPNGTLQSFLENYDHCLITTHRLHLLRDIANGLHYLHALSPPIIHGDLNSNNVLLDADYTPRLTDFGYSTSVGATSEAVAYLRRSAMKSQSLRWIPPEQVLCDSRERFQRTTKSDVYSFGSIALHACPHGTNVGRFLIHLQVLSGKQPWSEIDQDASVVLCLARGGKPGRPKSRPMDDEHWELINTCWSPMQEHRPTSKCIVSTIKLFLDRHPPAQLIRDLIAPRSRQGQSRFTSRRTSTFGRLHTVSLPNYQLKYLTFAKD